jgi:transposase
VIPAGVKIWAAAAPVDMRRGFVGLAEATREQLAQDPGNGALYVFTNKRRDRVKLLWHDRTGFCLLYNQPSSHYTSFASTRGLCSCLRDAPIAAARSVSRSHRLQCFVGRFGGSS